MIVNKTEKDIEKCPNRFRCLTEKKKKCDCIHRPVSYICSERTLVEGIAEHYKSDVCKDCAIKPTCEKKGYRMKFKGSSKRNGQWEHAVTIGTKNLYPLFRYLVFCSEYANVNMCWTPENTPKRV